MTETAYLDVELVEKTCYPLAVAVFDNNEDPIPSFSPHVRGLLESALNSPKQTFGGEELYPMLADKAAILFYSLIQNHPFRNGNKRIATASLLIFLFINNHWLEVGKRELAEKAITLARSGEDKRDSKMLIAELKTWVQSHLEKTRGE